MNNFKNEMEITLGSEKILLRPTFENVASMESNVGGLTYLAWKFSRSTTKDKDGKPIVNEAMIKNMPSLTEVAQIIFYNQAATKEGDPTLKKFSLEEIWDLVTLEGLKVIGPVTLFLCKITNGDKFKNDELSESEKKS